MALLRWSDDLITSIDIIDKQHIELFRLVNFYILKCNSKNGITYKEAKYVIIRLDQYADYHFKAEETYMITSGFPLVNEHKALHKALLFDIRKYETIIEANRENTNKQAFLKMGDFLASWLLSHVDIEDKKFIKYYKEKNRNTT